MNQQDREDFQDDSPKQTNDLAKQEEEFKDPFPDAEERDIEPIKEFSPS